MKETFLYAATAALGGVMTFGVLGCNASAPILNENSDIFIGDNILDLVKAPSGYAEIANLEPRAKVDGADVTRRLRLPKYEAMCFFAADGTWSENYPYVANRLNPWVADPVFGDTFTRSPSQDAVYVSSGRNGQYALAQARKRQYMALLPITAGKSVSWLYAVDPDGIDLKSSNFGANNLQGRVPLLSWATADNPYDAIREAWKIALASPLVKGKANFIYDKTYPEAFKYLGWCSWEQYHKNINIDLLCDTVEKIRKSGVPVRWFLVDDGFQIEEKLKLKSFRPDDARFKGGWGKLISMRNENRIKWFGLWHCYYGLWNGISTDNDLGVLNDSLLTVSKDTLMPGKSEADSKKFYDAFMGSVADYGFDFVKIDVQTGYAPKVKNLGDAAQRNNWCSQALEDACETKLDGLINCMAHGGATFFNAKHSSVIRCSVDYFKGKPNTAKSHLYQSYQNTMWLAHLYWPDHDMFHSSDALASKDMAVSKALSGAPVYLSDDPDDFVKDLIMRLCYNDGEILRPLAPAVPLPDSIFAQPLSNRKYAYRVIAPLKYGSAAIMLHNLSQYADKDPKFKNGMSLTKPEEQLDFGKPIPVKGWVDVKDYADAGLMMQPKAQRWQTPEEGLIWYDWFAGKGGALKDRQDFTIDMPLDGKLIIISPVKNGWGVIGLSGKYLSPSSLEDLQAKPASLTLKMREGGEFVIYLAKGEPVSDGIKFEALGNGLWKGIAPFTRFEITKKIN